MVGGVQPRFCFSGDRCGKNTDAFRHPCFYNPYGLLAAATAVVVTATAGVSAPAAAAAEYEY